VTATPSITALCRKELGSSEAVCFFFDRRDNLLVKVAVQSPVPMMALQSTSVLLS
jgi:hypothetical protein